MAKLATYLVKQHRAYLYKRAVPADLQHVLRRKTWTQSLKRLDDREAVRVAMQLAAEHDAIVEFVRALPAEERAKAERMGWEAYRALPDKLMTGARFVERVAALEDEEGAEEPEAAVMILSARRSAKALRAEAEAAKARLAPVDKPPQTLEAVIPAWKAAARRTPSEGTVAKMELYAGRFHKIAGPVAIDRIDRSHVSKFRDHLQAQAGKGEITYLTANKHLEAVARLLRVALSLNMIHADPSSGIKINRKEEGGDEDRLPFEAAHICAIFEAAKTEDADFQLILRLLAYHGMRSGEAAQLRVDDVTTSMGIPIIRIHGAFGSLKNRASKRDVPIHPDCLEALNAQVERLKGPDAEWLFPWLKTYKAGRGAWLQRFASDFLRDKVRITDPRLTLHSFRHTFRTLAREVDMPEAVSRALMGHTLGAGEHGKYGTAPSLAKRAEWIAKIDPLGH